MKKIISVCFLTFFIAATAFSQTYITRNGNISIYSHTPLEEVKAQNNEVASVLNAATGDLEFKLAVKSFHFEKTAMEDHFNDDDYMASGKYPKAGFKGKITNISSADLSKDGKYDVTASGDLTIRDVTKPVTTTGTLTVANGKVTLASIFTIKRKDYNVIGESFVQKKISEDIQITVKCQYDKQ